MVEVLSPSTRRPEWQAKFDAYEQAGVGPGESVESRVLEGFGADAAALFPADAQ